MTCCITISCLNLSASLSAGCVPRRGCAPRRSARRAPRPQRRRRRARSARSASPSPRRAARPSRSEWCTVMRIPFAPSQQTEDTHPSAARCCAFSSRREFASFTTRPSVRRLSHPRPAAAPRGASRPHATARVDPHGRTTACARAQRASGAARRGRVTNTVLSASVAHDGRRFAVSLSASAGVALARDRGAPRRRARARFASDPHQVGQGLRAQRRAVPGQEGTHERRRPGAWIRFLCSLRTPVAPPKRGERSHALLLRHPP